MTISTVVERNELAGEIIIEWLYKQFYTEKQFYEKVSHFTGQNSLQDCIIQHTTEIILNNIKDFSISDHEKYYMAYYYASSHALLLTKWIQNKMDVSLKEMAKYYDKWSISFWKQFYSKYTE